MDEYNLYLIKKNDSIRSKTKFCDEKGSQFLFADNLSLVIRFSKKKKKSIDNSSVQKSNPKNRFESLARK